MTTANREHQNRQWSIRPCDLDQLTRFCPENETSLLNMFEDENLRQDPDFQKKSSKNMENAAAVDSGFGSQELGDDGHMKGVKKNPLRCRTSNGRGGSTRFVKQEEDAEEFINRQIQEVLCFQEEVKKAGSLSDSQKMRQDEDGKRIGDTKATFKITEAEGSGN